MRILWPRAGSFVKDIDDIIGRPGQSIFPRPEVGAISFLIIDGYNLIGIQHASLGTQRDGLVSLLGEYKKTKGHEITVVFDGWKSGSGREESRMVGGVKVIYSRLGEKADHVIKRIISAEKKEWIVVSSDRDIMAHAWSQGSVPVSSERFRQIIERAGRTVAGEYELLEEEGDPDSKAGRSRTPSKKEKALARVLSKL